LQLKFEFQTSIVIDSKETKEIDPSPGSPRDALLRLHPDH